jgi:radical SAM superfamily enzyme YgiQ (UPF0313 family)
VAQDVAFIHAPQNIMHKKPIRFYIMPMGIVMLANVLIQEGFHSQVINLGIEQAQGDTPHQTLSQLKAPIFAIDVHWHVHLYDGIKAAALCKKLHPDAYIIIGGFTAAWFARDIISHFPFVDVVVRGDSEYPFVQVVKSILNNNDPGSIPNITYREGRKVVETQLQYVAKRKELSALPYVAEPLPVRHGELYFQREMHGDPCFPTFWFCCGRGCIYNCCWCGGAASAHQRLAKRAHMTYRDPERVAAEVGIYASILHSASFSHDVVAMGKHYAQQLFSSIRKENLDIGAYWEVFDPSFYSKDVLMEIARTFNPQRSKLAFSLGSADFKIREKSGMAAFSNDQLLKMLHNARALGLQAEGYFHILPPDTHITFEATLSFVEKIQKELKVPFFYWSAILDSASPMHVHPESFGLCLRINSFDDLWQAVSKGNPYTGYDLSRFTEQDMITLADESTIGLPMPIARIYQKTVAQRNALIGLTESDTDIAFETMFI